MIVVQDTYWLCQQIEVGNAKIYVEKHSTVIPVKKWEKSTDVILEFAWKLE